MIVGALAALGFVCLALVLWAAADIVITGTAVAVVSDPLKGQITQTKFAFSGGAITVGQCLYFDSTGRLQPTLVTDVSKSVLVGIAIASAPASGQAVQYAYAGDVTLGSVLTVGQAVWLGSAAGAMTTTVADLVTGWYPALVGLGVTTANLRLAIATHQNTAHA
jgi:hypothetical protein